MSNFIIDIKKLEKSFDNGSTKALRGVDLSIKHSEFVAIMGPSGCGKSTLLNMIAALDLPDSGEVIVDGDNLPDYQDLSGFRAKSLGFIFQLHNLIPGLSALENIQIPMIAAGVKVSERNKKAMKLIKELDLNGKETKQTVKLSGGERQRVAIARALANDPKIIIADEPTGALDSKNGEIVMKLLKKIHDQNEVTIVMVTHDQKVAAYADRIIKMLDGKVVN